jgi:hypothetical protein
LLRNLKHGLGFNDDNGPPSDTDYLRAIMKSCVLIADAEKYNRNIGIPEGSNGTRNLSTSINTE